MPIAEIPLEHSLMLATILFGLGLVGVLTRRNLIYVLICIEIMFNAAGFVFIAAGTRWGAADGQVMFILILAVAAANVSIGLALVLQTFRQFRGIDTDLLSRMRG